jgi:hypothetical protein
MDVLIDVLMELYVPPNGTVSCDGLTYRWVVMVLFHQSCLLYSTLAQVQTERVNKSCSSLSLTSRTENTQQSSKGSCVMRSPPVSQ